MPATRCLRAALFVLAFALLPFGAAHAQFVRNTNDSGPESLRALANEQDIAFAFDDDATITLTSGPLTLGGSGSTTSLILSDEAVTIAGNDINLAFSGSNALSIKRTGINPTSTLTFHSSITGTGYFLIDEEDITLVLTGTNSFTTGGFEDLSLFIDAPSTVEIDDDAALGAGTVELRQGAVLRISGSTTIDNRISLEDGVIETTEDAEITSLMSGSDLTIRGTASLTLSGSGNYSGTTTIESGTLITKGGSAIRDSAAMHITGGGTLRVQGLDETIGDLSGAGDIVLDGLGLTINQSGNTTFSGVISGNGDLVKSGNGTLVLQSNQQFTGTTTVEAGSLVVEATGSLEGDVDIENGTAFTLDGVVHGTVVAADGSTLDGSGTINGNLVLMGSATADGVVVLGNTITRPEITSTGTASGTYRSSFTTYTLTADNDPTSLAHTAGSLPAGLTFNAGAGTIAGTPTASGVFNVTLSASNAAGTDTLDLAITIAKVTVTPVVTVEDRMENGTTNATVTSCTLAGVLGGDTVDLTCGAATFDDAAPGNDKVVTVGGLGLSGAHAAHYALAATTTTTTADITPQPPERSLTRVARGQTIDGITIDGLVDNRGTLLNVTLLPGAEIRGGRVGGRIIGTPGHPALVDSFILPGASLQHVRLGLNTVIALDAHLGAGVCFMSAANIPPGLALGGVMTPVAESTALVLDAPVVCSARPLLATLGGVPGTVTQDVSGRLLLQVPAGPVALWPVAVLQGDAGERAGYGLDADGNARLVTDDRIVIVAHPALQDETAARAAFARLRLDLSRDDANGNFILDPLNGSGAGVNHRFSGRPHFVALPQADDIEPGLYFVPQQGTQLPLATVVFRNDDTLLAQYVVPAPGDWESLRANLLGQPGAESARIDAHGVIHAVIAGNNVRGMMDYRIEHGEAPLSGRLEWRNAGDVNGDGIADLLVIYANGDRQVLYRLP